MTKSTSYGAARSRGATQRAGSRPNREPAPWPSGPAAARGGEQQPTRANRAGRKIAAAGLIGSAALALPAAAALASPSSVAVPSPAPGSVLLTAHDVLAPGTQFRAYTVGQPLQSIQPVQQTHSSHSAQRTHLPSTSALVSQTARAYAAKPGSATRNLSQAGAGQSPDGTGRSPRDSRTTAPASRDLPIYRQSQRHLQRLRGTEPIPQSQGASAGGWQAVGASQPPQSPGTPPGGTVTPQSSNGSGHRAPATSPRPQLRPRRAAWRLVPRWRPGHRQAQRSLP
jgi:hypothetical protein